MSSTRREERRTYHQAYWREHKHRYEGRQAQALGPGQFVAHCGQWQRITQLPHVCPRCGTPLFAEEHQPS
jgi:hypothetical protein